MQNLKHTLYIPKEAQNDFVMRSRIFHVRLFSAAATTFQRKFFAKRSLFGMAAPKWFW